MMISVIVRMGFFARFNLIQRCSRPLPAVGQNGFSGLMGILGLQRCSLHKVAGHTSSIQDKGEQADCLRQIPPFWGYASPL